MKIRNIALPVFLLAFLMYGCGNNLFSSIADDSSNDACIYETSKNLDKGNYDSVIASSCVDNLQKGAAYLGKAGFEVTDVITGLNDSQDSENALDDYLKSIVPVVSENSLNNLDLSADEYAKVEVADDDYEDAQLYFSIVKAIRSLSLVKLLIDIDGDGITACDNNNNDIPDEVDAAACSLVDIVTPGSCTGATAVRTATDITIQGKSSTYRGLTVTINGTATASCPADYMQLHYLVSGTTYGVATITSESCQETAPDTSRTWPCPIETGTGALDLVDAFSQAITDGIEAIENSFTTDNDLSESIEDIKTEACGIDGVCTSVDISEYLNEQLVDTSL